jgi:hypothetical protein
MADNQTNPHVVEQHPVTGPESIGAAQEALLGLLDSEEQPAEEEQPSEETQDVEASDEAIEDSETEEVEEEEESEDVDDDESEESEEEEVEDEDESESTVYTVKVNGQDVEVSEDELIKGYSRQQDYTQKTQQLAEYKRQMDVAAQQMQQEVAQTQQMRSQYVDALSTAIDTNYAHLQQYANVDWETLKSQDKEEYLTKRDEYRQAQESIQGLQAQAQQAQQQQEREMQMQHQQVLQEEHAKMVSILPEWNDPNTQRAIAKSLSEFALSKGYTQEELSQLVDHRSILVLMQAKAYEDMTRKQHEVRAKKVKNKPKVVKTRARREKGEVSEGKRAGKMKRLQKSGHVDDAASLLEDLLKS